MSTHTKHVCYRCSEAFVSQWSDEEALDELERRFPGTSVDDCYILCDACYKMMFPDADFSLTGDCIMALSNIFNEPRREITETAVGILIVGAVISIIALLDYHYVAPFIDGDKIRYSNFPAAMFFGFLAIACAIGAVVLWLMVVHSVGEKICNALQRRGVHLRPRERQGGR